VADDLQGTTHAEGCHTWGHRHYECALAALARKDAEIAAANAEIDELVRALKLCTQRAERDEARVREAPVVSLLWIDGREWQTDEVPDAALADVSGKRVALVLLDTEEAK
jgi:hypothetical protein